MTNFFTSRETSYRPRVSDTPATDLTAITTPFGLLDDATQAALKAHGGPYVCYRHTGWVSVDEPVWSAPTVYRIAPAPAPAYTPDDVPWDAVVDRFNWYARDESGWLEFFAEKPKKSNVQWISDSEMQCANCFKITIGNAPWDKSLQRRPGK